MPRLLDLFCGAGGASVGYARAGFDVVGVDIEPHPDYPFTFHQADAMTFPLDGFDVVHASPPCQQYSSAGKAAQATLGKVYPDLYAATRDRLIAWGGIWVIENVTAAPSRSGVTLCGSHFGLGVRRHRTFESSHLILSPFVCDHTLEVVTVTGHTPARWDKGNRTPVPQAEAQEAMGIDWMTTSDLVQAIPPAYTEWIGAQLLDHLSTGIAPHRSEGLS